MRDYYGDIDEEERFQAIHTIINQSKRLCDMVESLLRLSEAQGIEGISLEPLDMGEIVQRSCENLRGVILDSGACIATPEHWPGALGYAPWVEHIWANYLSNAIKYGGLPPLIQLGAEPSARGYVTFWVRDNGTGLSHDQQLELFQPFVRHVDKSVEGHGLGLAIVARIVERLGGQVGVESSINQGSTFTFSLPVA
jgi:signal transduction histidine kinase